MELVSGNKYTIYVIVRIDYYYDEYNEHSINYKKAVWSRTRGESEVIRLNKLNKSKYHLEEVELDYSKTDTHWIYLVCLEDLKETIIKKKIILEKASFNETDLETYIKNNELNKNLKYFIETTKLEDFNKVFLPPKKIDEDKKMKMELKRLKKANRKANVAISELISEKNDIAKRLMGFNIDIEIISKATGLCVTYIEEIMSEQ